MEKLIEYLVKEGVWAVENVDRFNDAEDYLVDNLKIVEEIFLRLCEGKKFFFLYSVIVKDHSRVISEKIKVIKNLYIMYAQDLIWSPTNYRAAIADLCETIISPIDDFIKRINEGRLRHDFEEFRTDVERAVYVLNDVKVRLLERLDELESLFENL